MKADRLRDMTPDEIGTRVQELREQLLKLRFQQSTGQIESPQMLRSVRKDIARAETVLRERQLGIGAEVAATTEPAAPAETGADSDTED